MCLTCKTTEKHPRQGSHLSARMGRSMEKDWSMRPSDHQLPEAQEKTDSHCQWLRQSMSLYTWCHHHPRDPSSCATFMFKPHCGAELPQAKKKKIIASMQVGVTLVMPNSLQPCGLWPHRLLCCGVLQARTLEGIGQYWLPYPSRELYFLLP